MEGLLINGGALLFCLLVVSLYVLRIKRREDKVRQAMADNLAAGLTEPPSLHPQIRPERCIGSGACVRACPEKMILGLVGNTAHLVNPTACVGHGSCEAACPVSAIDLVFGTARRGVDIPRLRPDFQSNVPGLYIAGELGGMGLIRNAVTQGRQAAEHIARNLKGAASRPEADEDLLIIGAGPAGLSAALQAQSDGLSCLLLDQDDAGGAIRHYPRAKLVMTQVMQLPGEPPFPHKTVLKEDLMAYVDEVMTRRGPRLRGGCCVTGIRREGEIFRVSFRDGGEQRSLSARCVLLAIGRRGSPRRLQIPGEDSPRFIYALPDPEAWAGASCVVVGGGDSALEATLRLSEQPDTRVCLVYRGEAFTRARQANRAAMEAAVNEGRVRLLLNTTPMAFEEPCLHVKTPAGEEELPADMICVQIGGELPTALLREAGIKVDVHFGSVIREAEDA